LTDTAPVTSSRRTATGNSKPNVADPVGELRFRVTLDDDTDIGYFSECSGLSIEYDVMEYQEGGENRFTHKLRGHIKYPNLVLKRGVTYEQNLLKWFFQTTEWDKRGGITLTLLGPDGKPVRTWGFASAVPVKWQGPNFSASSNNAAVETLEIAHLGLVLQA
jgi:phage tail-like protein